MKHVVVAAGFPAACMRELESLASVQIAPNVIEVARAAAAEVVALIPMVQHPVTDELLAVLPNLRIVATPARGTDHIDLAACRARGVCVTTSGRATAEATADVAFGLLLMAARRLGEGERLVRAQQWHGFGADFMLGKPVFRMTLGLVGCGFIGQAVARRARGFGMQVLYTQRTQLAPEVERALGLQFVAALDDLLPRVDALSLHAPLSESTRHLLNARTLALLPKGAMVINTARGQLIDDAALAAALLRGHLHSAGLDVFSDEPQILAEYLQLDNVVLTPHLGSADTATRARMLQSAVDNVAAVLAGRAPLDPA